MDPNYSIKNQIRQERVAFVKSFFRNACFGLILIFIAFGIYFAFNILNNRFQNTLQIKLDEVNDLNHQLTADLAQTQVFDSISRYTSSGIDLERKAKDDNIVNDILVHYANWSSRDDAGQKMGDFAVKYKGSENSINDFNYVIYGIQSYGVIGLNTGEVYKDRRVDVNQVYNGMTSHVTEIKNGVYKYYTLVHLTRDNGLGPVSGDVLIGYTVAEDGKVSLSGQQDYIIKEKA